MKSASHILAASRRLLDDLTARARRNVEIPPELQRKKQETNNGKGEDGDRVGDERSIGRTAARVLQALIHGEYRNGEGRMVPGNRDLSKLFLVKGLSPRDLAMVRKYQFMSTRIPGTRQVRNEIRHIIFASRVFYGIPVFMTITPGERHSGLAIHLFRGRPMRPFGHG